MNKSFNITAVIILGIIALSLTNCKSDKINSPQESGTIEGIVSNSFTGDGIENVLVELEGGSFPASDTTTDESGFYSFQNVSPGNYVLYTIKYGYESGKDTIIVYTGNMATANVELSPGELIGTWSATNVYIPQLDQNFIMSELGIEMEITLTENGEYHGITSDSSSSNVNEGNWYTSDGILIILDSEIGEREGEYIREDNILTLKNWSVDYQGAAISVDVTFLKQ